MSDGVVYVTGKGIDLVAWKRRGVGITQWWDSGGIQLFDMGYVCGPGGGNRLRCSSSGNSSSILIIVRGLLGAAVLSGICGAAILFEPANLHSRIKEEGNVTTVCCVDAITDGVANGHMVALVFCGRCKDKHVKVKQKPPEWCRAVNGVASNIGFDDGSDDGSLKVRKC